MKPCLLCVDDNGIQVCIHVEYTNLVHSRLSDDQHGDMPCFTYKDLVELRKIVDSIKVLSS